MLKEEEQNEQKEEEAEYVCNNCGLVVTLKRTVQGEEEEGSMISEESDMSGVNASEIIDDRSEEPSCSTIADDETGDGLPDGMSSELTMAASNQSLSSSTSGEKTTRRAGWIRENERGVVAMGQGASSSSTGGIRCWSFTVGRGAGGPLRPYLACRGFPSSFYLFLLYPCPVSR